MAATRRSRRTIETSSDPTRTAGAAPPPARARRRTKGRRERRIPKALGSLDQVFALLDEFFAAEGLGSDVEFPLKVATEEIFTNFVKYNAGSSHEILITLSRAADEAVVELMDFDVEPFRPEDAPPFDVDAPLEKRHPGGLGLHLVKALVDKVTFEYRDRALEVTLRKRIG